MQDVIAKIRDIEYEAYKDVPYMCQMQDIYDISDLAEYCECDESEVKVFMNNKCYMIIADKKDECEIVDLANSGIPSDVIPVVNEAASVLKGRKATLDARESTSYRLVKLFERSGKLSIMSDSAYEWGDEKMHELVVAVPMQNELNRAKYMIPSSKEGKYYRQKELENIIANPNRKSQKALVRMFGEDDGGNFSSETQHCVAISLTGIPLRLI